MNTLEIATLEWDEQELSDLVADFVRQFRRLPSREELEMVRALRQVPA